MSQPRVHEAAGVPAEIAQELAESFELVTALGGADGVVVTPAVAVDDAFLDEAGPQLRIVANYAVGLDNVDLDATRARGVVVSNTPGVLTNATAEHAIALVLSLLRRIGEGDRSLRRRDAWEWGPDFMVGESLEGKEVLVVGPGRIGRRVAELVEAHGARPTFAGRDDDVLELVSRVDVVTLHCPLTPETRHLVNAARPRRDEADERARQHCTGRGRRRIRARRRARAGLDRRSRARRLRARAGRQRGAARDGERRPHAARRERDA